MYRKKTIALDKEDVTIKVQLEVNTGPAVFTKDEAAHIINTLTDRIMEAIRDVPYIPVHLADIKVK